MTNLTFFWWHCLTDLHRRNLVFVPSAENSDRFGSFCPPQLILFRFYIVFKLQISVHVLKED